jgi:hypothetical protein
MAGQTPEKIQEAFVDLDYTQDIRRKIVTGIASKAISDGDPEMLDKTMKALDGMDKQSLGKLKLNEKDKENQTNASNSEALAKYLVSLSDRRSTSSKPEIVGSDVPGQKLPEGRRPSYDSSIRDATAGTENTAEFTSRVEGTTKS